MTNNILSEHFLILDYIKEDKKKAMKVFPKTVPWHANRNGAHSFNK